MISLTPGNRVLEVVLAGVVATAELNVSVNWLERGVTGQKQNSWSVTTNGTTAVVLLSPCSGGESKLLEFLGVYNSDSAAATVTLRMNESGVFYTLAKVTLGVGERLEYSAWEGFSCFTALGELKVVTANYASILKVNKLLLFNKTDSLYYEYQCMTVDGEVLIVKNDVPGIP